MKKKITILVGLFLFLVIWLAPVQIVEGFIPANKGFTVSGLKGTVWSGKIDSLEVQHLSLREVDYSLGLISLLTGNLGGSAKLNKGDIKGDLTFEISDPKNIEVSDADLNFSAQVIESFLPFPGILLDGKLFSENLNAKISNNKAIFLSGKTRWDNAKVTFAKKEFEIGKLEILWSTDIDKKIITGKIIKTQNILSLEGDITLSASGLFDFNGSVTKKMDKTIYNSLLFFANGKEKNGRLPIRFRKKLG